MPARPPLCVFALLVLTAALAACAPPRAERRFEFNRLCMGVQCRVVLYAAGEPEAAEAAAGAFERIARLDAAMSDYRPDSELMRLCDGAGGPPVRVSDDLFDILRTAQRVSEASGGAFDVTVGPAVALWREARAAHQLPDASRVSAARSLVNWRNVVLDEQARTVRLAAPGMRLDLGAIAKGYAADRALRVLRARGHPRALVALAGDIAVGAPPPGERGWRVAVRAEPEAEPRVLLLTNLCVSTSGDAEQTVKIAGIRYAHIIDPRTGLGLTRPGAATVVAPAGEIADAAATAACVIGADAEPFLRQLAPIAALMRATDSAGQSIRREFDPGGLLRWDSPPAPPHVSGTLPRGAGPELRRDGAAP